MMTLFMYEGYLRNRRQLCEALDLQPAKTWDRNRIEREILCRGFDEWGCDLPKHLLGAFAFGFRDADSGEVFCARDAFGIQNLYYHVADEGQLLCALNLTDIVERDEYSKDIDMVSLQRYLCFGYPAGEETIYRCVRKLMPGHRMHYMNGREECVITDRWFTPVFRPDTSLSEKEWVRKVNGTMDEILEDDRFNMDYNDGVAFLSGGVDSSYLLASSGIKNSCGVGFTDSEADELSLAKETAGRLDADFHELRISDEEFFGTIPDFVRSMELPMSDVSAICFYAGCRFAAGKGSFVYSGEGADEFFAGYHIYRRAEYLAWDDGPRHYGCYGVMDGETAARLLKMDRHCEYESLVTEYYEQTQDCEHLSRLLMIDIGLWFEGDILLGAGRSARNCGLELLLPYADMRMFELSSRVPSSLKLTKEHGKYILRRAAESRLPEETAFRTKAGFPTPASRWFRSGKCRAGMEEVLFGDRAEKFFDMSLLRSWWDAYQAGEDRYFRHVFTVYVFLIWHEVCY